MTVHAPHYNSDSHGNTWVYQAIYELDPTQGQPERHSDAGRLIDIWSRLVPDEIAPYLVLYLRTDTTAPVLTVRTEVPDAPPFVSEVTISGPESGGWNLIHPYLANALSGHAQRTRNLLDSYHLQRRARQAETTQKARER